MRKLLTGILIIFGALQARAQTAAPIRFAFLTDIHVSPGIPSEKGLAGIVSEINTQPFDFVVLTGDLTNTGTDAELNAVHTILKNLKYPLYVIPGNHETNWSESAAQTFVRLWGNDRFYFEKDKYIFVGYNTGPYMKMGDGHIKEEDIHWLKKTLSQRVTPGKTVISLCHYPLGDGLDNWQNITGFLQSKNTRLALCGHGHKLSVHNFGGIPGVMGRSSLPYKGTDLPGYNIVTLRNDSAIFQEKTLMQEAVPFKAFSLQNADAIKDVKPSPLPDYSINDKFPQVKPVFTFQDTSASFTGPLPLETQVIFGNSQGEVIALNAANKKVNWRRQFTGSIYATPLAGKGIITVGTVDGYIHGLDAKTGRDKWKLPVTEPVISEGIVEGDRLYIGVGSHAFYCININNGKVFWKNDSMNGQMQGKPATTDKEIVFGAWDRHLYCLNKATGELKWKWNNGSQQKLYSPGNVKPAIVNGRVFIVAPDRYMTAIDLSTGQTIWRNNRYRVREAMEVSPDGKAVYAKLMEDTVIAVSTSAPAMELLWYADAKYGYEHNPCPLLESNGTLYAGTKNGLLIAIDVATHQVKWTHKAGNSSINKIVADKNGDIWISLIEGKLQKFPRKV
ncbi:PQQ-binding-like beta-propeller repeat protein [Chitinophaga horti]|uniref:PQQ-binding-like beta-propeller repeat protein n=1 Tax=Chitinophaga horti TaxID=2920382 RepID=A0ABY6J533_9BACT|nr:PQQ-binding-like beta-propeller repeat protein [Chitinophaga horti]UYQ94615.1 PQQ-binding-like beta-propeller repeat protein [Chitinophaga horti]